MLPSLGSFSRYAFPSQSASSLELLLPFKTQLRYHLPKKHFQFDAENPGAPEIVPISPFAFMPGIETWDNLAGIHFSLSWPDWVPIAEWPTIPWSAPILASPLLLGRLQHLEPWDPLACTNISFSYLARMPTVWRSLDIQPIPATVSASQQNASDTCSLHGKWPYTRPHSFKLDEVPVSPNP